MVEGVRDTADARHARITSGAGPHPVANFLTHHYVELLALLAVLFVAQTGLVPFDFFHPVGGEGDRSMFGVAPPGTSIPDIVSNMFLYVPLGMLLYWSFLRHTRNGVAAAAATALFAAALSGGIEWIQAYSPSRVSSSVDFVCNMIGASLGLAIACVARWILPKLIGAVILEFHQQPQMAAVKAYVCLLVFLALMPFSLSFDLGLFKRSLKSIDLVPFASVAAHQAEAREALATDDERAYAMARWKIMRCWLRWITESVSFVVLVWLVVPPLLAHYGFNQRGAAAIAFWLCGVLAIFLSLVQIPILTRSVDATDVLFRWVGIGIGLVTRTVYDRRDRAGSTVLSKSRASVQTLAAGAVFVYIVVAGLMPFTFDAGMDGVSRSLQSKALLPFFAYFVTRFDLMIADVMEKFASYAILAGLLVGAWPALRAKPIHTRVLFAMGAGVAVSVPVELTQMFVPVRVTSLTDPILAACGCAVGILAQQQLVTFHRFATSAERVGADLHKSEGPTPRLGPTDELISTLTEEREGAPTEHPPAPQRSGKR